MEDEEEALAGAGATVKLEPLGVVPLASPCAGRLPPLWRLCPEPNMLRKFVLAGRHDKKYNVGTSTIRYFDDPKHHHRSECSGKFNVNPSPSLRTALQQLGSSTLEAYVSQHKSTAAATGTIPTFRVICRLRLLMETLNETAK